MKFMDFLAQIFSGGNIAVLGAAFTLIMAGTGSARGVGMAGEAAAGVVAEDPTKFVRTLMLQALPGTQGIYGLIIAFIIMTKVGLLGGAAAFEDVSLTQGMALFFASLPMAVVGYTSAIAQAKVSISGMQIAAKRPEETTKGMIFAGLVETYAVFALLISFLLISGIKVG